MRATFDSRLVRPGMTFVALKGEKADGRDFIPAALAAGATRILVGYEALDAAALERRKALDATVIAVTGSAGKTTTKELLRAFLSAAGNTFATEGNFNNHIGLPLTILNCPDDARFLVLEMGTNHPGEIAHLCDIALPDVGIVTNYGTAHIENFGSREAIAAEKGTVLERAREFAVAPGCVPPLPEELSSAVARVLPGAHNQANAALAFAVAAHFGVTPQEAAAKLDSFALPGERWRKSTSTDGVHFIDDTYNANPDSMRAALDTFASLDCPSRRIAILGDMFELGPRSQEYHEEVFNHAATLGLDLVVAVGETSSRCRASLAFPDAPALKAGFSSLGLKPGDTVLLKASHAMHLGSILKS